MRKSSAPVLLVKPASEDAFCRDAFKCRLALGRTLGRAILHSDPPTVHSAQTTRSWFLGASCWFCCRGVSECAEEELGKTVDGAQRWRFECHVLPFLGASGGFPQVVIQDRRCHRFWRDDKEGKKAFPLLRSQALLAGERAFSVSIRRPYLMWRRERGNDVLM